MADFPVDRPWELVVAEVDHQRLMGHFFPGDSDEHGAILIAGVHVLADRVRLLVRDVVLAIDGVDHVEGKYGYRMLKAQFIRQFLVRARNEQVVYLSAHNHLGGDYVAFSPDDLASHERGYPTLLDLVGGMPVGALVYAQNAMAGDIWLPGRRRVKLKRCVVVGNRRRFLYPESPKAVSRSVPDRYDRQVRLFGAAGQVLLKDARVGIVGVGGVGSILAELLGRLGVGHFVLVDPDRADKTNLPRLIGASKWDAILGEKTFDRLGVLGRAAGVLRRRKVDLAGRNIARANPAATVERVCGSIADPDHLQGLLLCDYIFLAADEMLARLLCNAIVHQYLIPGVQVGARVVTDPDSGAVTDVYAVSRPVTPNAGCLLCNSLIDATKLQIEATDKRQAERQRYGTESPAPSVVTLNALAAAEAANAFMFYVTGLGSDAATRDYMRFRPALRTVRYDMPRQSELCSECGRGPHSRYGRGDHADLPTR